jgi:hypothetical protein
VADVGDTPFEFGDAANEQLKQQKRDESGKRHPTRESTAQEYLTKAKEKHEQSGSDEEFPITWDTVKGHVDAKADWLTEEVRTGLWYLGIDAVAIEIGLELGVTVGAVGLNYTPIGLAAYFPTHTALDETDKWQQAVQNGERPIEDAPHWFFYTGASINVGIGAGASIGVDWSFAFADHFGDPEKITADAWAGPVVAIQGEVAAATPIAGLETSRSLFTSVGSGSNPDPHSYGLIPPIQPPNGFQGVAASVEPKTGFELQITGGVGGAIADEVNNALAKFSQPQLQDDLQRMKNNPEKGSIPSDAEGGAPDDGGYYRGGDRSNIDQVFMEIFGS